MPISVEARERLVGELVHARQRQRLVVRQLERLDPVVGAHLADEGARRRRAPGWALVNGPISVAGIERLASSRRMSFTLSPR